MEHIITFISRLLLRHFVHYTREMFQNIITLEQKVQRLTFGINNLVRPWSPDPPFPSYILYSF